MLAWSCTGPGSDINQPDGAVHARLDSMALSFEDDPQQTVSELRDMLRSVKQDTALRCRMYTRLASAYDNLGETDSALTYWAEVLDACQQDRDSYLTGLVNRAILLKSAGELDLAKRNLHQAIELSTSSSDYRHQSSALQTLAAIHFDLQEYDSCETAAQRLLEVAYQQNDSVSIAQVLMTLGSIFNDLGKYTEALQYMRQAEVLTRDRDAERMHMYALMNVGASHDYLARYDSAQVYYDAAHNIAMRIGDVEMQVHLMLNDAYLHYEEGNYQQAFDQFESATDTEDSVLSASNKARIAELEVKYHTKEKETAIRHLTQESRIAQLQRNFFIALAFLFLALATAAVVIYTHRSRTDRLLNAQRIAQLEKEKEVMSLQSMLFAQEEERQRIARDLHDSIGALLGAAKLHLSNIEAELERLAKLDFLKSTEEILERASSEVRRVAHDMMPGVLMKLGLFEGIEDYFDRLRKSVRIQLSFTHDELDQRLDNKTEVMVYRIVQELVNNTLKHAQASEIKLMIKVGEGQLILDYRDDGVGFDPVQLDDQSNVGLSSVKSRVGFLEGTVQLKSDATRGTHYSIQIPIV